MATNVEKPDIFKAIKENEVEIVESLITIEKVDINQQDSDGNTPLMLAINLNFEEIVILLLKNKVQTDKPDKDGDLCLHKAIKLGNEKMCNALLDHGVDISSQNREGNTALHQALNSNRAELVKLLLKKGKTKTNPFLYNGCDNCLTLKNNKNDTPIDIIKKKFQTAPNRWQKLHKIITKTTPKKVQARRESILKSKPKKKQSSETAKPAAKKRKLEDIWDGTHSASTIRKILHGILFQVNLLTLTLMACFDKKFDFNLGSEVDAAGKLDDVVIRYRDGVKKFENKGNQIQGQKPKQDGVGDINQQNETKEAINTWRYRFIQAKHTLNPENKENQITVASLLSHSDKNPFSLQKYYCSFCRLLESNLFQADPNYIDHIEDIVIITNAVFDFNDENNSSVSKQIRKSTKANWKEYFEEKSLPKHDFLYIKEDSRIKISKFKKEVFDEVKKAIKLALEKKKKNIKLIYDDIKMTKYLEKLVFITGYHKEEILDEELSKKTLALDGDFLKISLKNEIINFLKMYDNGRAEFLSYVKTKEMLKKLNEKMNIFKASVLTECYLTKLEAYKLSFSKNVLMDFGNLMKNSILDSGQKDFEVVTKSPLLTAIKMSKTLTSESLCEKFDYLKRRSFIFLHAEDLKHENISKLVFGLNEGHKILIVQYDSSTINAVFLNEIPVSSGKKIIKIVPYISTSTPSTSNSCSILIQIRDEKINFNDLDEFECQPNLMKKEVCFQGKPLMLEQLIKDNVAKKLIDSECLTELITKEISIGNDDPFSSYGYKNTNYISRNLSYQMIKTSILGKNNAEKALFFVTNFNPIENKGIIPKKYIHQWKDQKDHRNGVILHPKQNTEKDQELFQKLCKDHNEETIY